MYASGMFLVSRHFPFFGVFLRAFIGEGASNRINTVIINLKSVNLNCVPDGMSVVDYQT